MRELDMNGPMDRERTERLLRAIGGCSGAHAKVVAFTESHRMLILQLTLADKQPVTLMFGECSRIETSTRWTVERLDYRVVSSDPYRYRLIDPGAAFSVECGVVFVTDDPDEWRSTELELS